MLVFLIRRLSNTNFSKGQNDILAAPILDQIGSRKVTKKGTKNGAKKGTNNQTKQGAKRVSKRVFSKGINQEQ